jgi:hypothetical protein
MAVIVPNPRAVACADPMIAGQTAENPAGIETCFVN